MNRKPHIVFIFVTVLLDVMAAGMIVPVLPTLLRELLNHDHHRVATMFGVLGTLWALMQFLFSPVLGALSDKLGRRPVILLSNFGLGLDNILLALAPSLGWLCVGRIISGISSATSGTAAAYMADITAEDKRTESYGMLAAAWCSGIAVGPAIGGMLGSINPRLPFWVAAALGLINGMYGFFVLPESLPKHLRSPFSWAQSNPFGSWRCFRFHKSLYRLTFVSFLGMLAYQAFGSIFVLYSGVRFHWTAREIGFALSLSAIFSGIVPITMLPAVVQRFGEKNAIYLGLLAEILSFHIIASANNGTLLLIGTCAISSAGISSPTIQGIMSRCVSTSQQGQLQGMINSVSGMAMLVGPWMFTQVFLLFTESRLLEQKIPGAPFYLSELILVISLLLVWRVPRHLGQ